MRLVIDTNVLYSALYATDSIPARLLRLAASGRLTLLAPTAVRDELREILRVKLKLEGEEAYGAIGALPVEWIPESAYRPYAAESEAAIRDPDDAPVVAVAILAGCGIVSGDKAFHPLRRPVARTWTPRQVWDRLR